VFEFCFGQEINIFILLSKPWVSVILEGLFISADSGSSENCLGYFFAQLGDAGTLLLTYTDYLSCVSMNEASEVACPVGARTHSARGELFSCIVLPPQFHFRHRIIERFGLEGTFRGRLAQPPCSEQGHLQLDQVAQSPVHPGLECF